MKRINKKSIILKIVSIIMIVSICSLTVVIPCFADSANTRPGSSGNRSYINTYGIDTLSIRDTSFYNYNGIYSLDKYKNSQLSIDSQFHYDYVDNITSKGSANNNVVIEATTTSSQFFGEKCEVYKRNLILTSSVFPRMEFQLDNMFVGSNSLDNYSVFMPLLSLSTAYGFNTSQLVDNISYSFYYYNRVNAKYEEYTDILSYDNTKPIYAVDVEERGIYIRFNPIPLLDFVQSDFTHITGLKINVGHTQTSASYIGITTYNYGFANDVVNFDNGLMLVPPSQTEDLYKLTVFNDISEFGSIGNFFDTVLNSFTSAEIVPGVAIGSVFLLILAFGVLIFLLKIALGG